MEGVNMNPSKHELLKRVYESDENSGGPLCIPFTDEKTGEFIPNLSTLRADVTYLIQHGYLYEPTRLPMCHNLSLTDKGEEYVENNFSRSTQQPSTFDFSGATINNAVIGNDISGNDISFSSGAALDELEALIQKRPPEDQELLQELLCVLREIQRSGKPVEKGRLARFYEVVKKSSELLLPIGTFFTDLFFREVG